MKHGADASHQDGGTQRKKKRKEKNNFQKREAVIDMTNTDGGS